MDLKYEKGQKSDFLDLKKGVIDSREKGRD
jgi:hypothetical protein